MELNTLKLTDFKNYRELELHFSPGINCLLGKNGMGKTNLLDAMYYLSMTRSAFHATDQHNIRIGERFFAVSGDFKHDQLNRVNCYYESGKKKIIKTDGKEVDKLSDHIGKIPSVFIAPDDAEIIREGSEVRRKLFDSVISQHDSQYLNHLIDMQRLLKQRNALLKKNEGRLSLNKKLLEVYDEQLIPVFHAVAKARITFLSTFAPYLKENYTRIFDGKETPTVHYKTQSTDPDFPEIFKRNMEKDIILQRTSLGAHRDDYTFKLNDRMIKRFGSQGQQKSFLIALKLAEYDYLKVKKGFSPLLLLDDIFDKLDDERIERLVNLLADSKRFSQIFLTDARVERSHQFFAKIDGVRFFEIENGQLKA